MIRPRGVLAAAMAAMSVLAAETLVMPVSAGAADPLVALVVSGEAPLDPNAVALATGGAGTVTARVDAVGMSVVEVPAGRVAAAERALEALDGVDHVDRDRTFRKFDLTPDDPFWSLQAASMGAVRAPAAWDLTTGSSSVTIAVVDSGVDAVPDLSGRLLSGYDFVNGDADASDDDGHGTATALVAAAAGNNGTGVAGLCWSCLVLPVKVLDDAGYGSMSDVVAGIVWAVDRGADVINLSLGGDTTVPAVSSAIRYALDRDVVVVASAGNDGRSDRNYPAAESGVIAVTGLGVDGLLHPSARRGPTWVDVAAPWCNEVAFGGPPLSFCGTSSSTPMVTGAVALLRGVRPSATREMITNAVYRTAVFGPTAGQVGYGTLDVAAATASIGGVGPGPVDLPPDVTAPAISADLPTGFLRDTAGLTVRSSDDQGVAVARVFVNGGLVASQSNPAASQAVTFDTRGFSDGSYPIDVDVVDGAGHRSAVPTGSITIDNAAPLGLLTRPTSGSTVTGSLTARVFVTDPNGIMGTFLIANDRVIGGFQGAGWGEATMAITRSGPVRVVAITVDRAGRIAGTNSAVVNGRVARSRRRR